MATFWAMAKGEVISNAFGGTHRCAAKLRKVSYCAGNIMKMLKGHFGAGDIWRQTTRICPFYGCGHVNLYCKHVDTGVMACGVHTLYCKRLDLYHRRVDFQ
jgi:hypothetical protein